MDATIINNLLMFLGGGTVTSLITFFINRHDKMKDKEENIKALTEEIGELKQQLNIYIEYGKLNSKAIILIYRKMLTQECQKWIELGYCPANERDALREEFEVYAEHHGNHGVQLLYDKVVNLPFSDEKDEN